MWWTGRRPFAAGSSGELRAPSILTSSVQTNFGPRVRFFANQFLAAQTHRRVYGSFPFVLSQPLHYLCAYLFPVQRHRNLPSLDLSVDAGESPPRGEPARSLLHKRRHWGQSRSAWRIASIPCWGRLEGIVLRHPESMST